VRRHTQTHGGGGWWCVSEWGEGKNSDHESLMEHYRRPSVCGGGGLPGGGGACGEGGGWVGGDETSELPCTSPAAGNNTVKQKHVLLLL